MLLTKVVSLVAVLAIAVSAQIIALTGKVTGQGGKALSGAVVTLVGKKLKDTTDAAGAYAISGTISAVSQSAALRGAEAIFLKNGTIAACVSQAGQVSLDYFDMQGHLIERVVEKVATAGLYQFDVIGAPKAVNMMVIRVAAGKQTASFCYVPISKGLHATASSTGSLAGRSQTAQVKAIVDSLQVTASGYKSKKVTISSYEATTDIALEQEVAGVCTPSKAVNTSVSGSGPHKVVIETNSDAGINKGTIFRPADLSGDVKFPIFLWGEGGCSQNGLSNKAAMGEIASWGYFVVADGTPSSGAAKTSSSNMGDPKQFYGYLDWLFAQNKNSCSAYYEKLDTTKVAADGFSCGGLMSINASGDPRFTAIGYTSSGLFSADQALYKKIHTPIKILNGGPESAGNDMAYENGARDFTDMSKVGIKVLYYVKTSAGHGGDLSNGKGDFNTINLAWLNWQLKGDTGATGKALLIGESCKFCKNSGWEFKTANLE